MRVVIDTNVLVSAALKDKDPEAVIKWVIAHLAKACRLLTTTILTVSKFKRLVCDVIPQGDSRMICLTPAKFAAQFALAGTDGLENPRSFGLPRWFAPAASRPSRPSAGPPTPSATPKRDCSRRNKP
jgi:hypothetical protein